jgi:hypothetical protein
MTAGSNRDDVLDDAFLRLAKRGSTLAGVMNAFSMAIRSRGSTACRWRPGHTRPRESLLMSRRCRRRSRGEQRRLRTLSAEDAAAEPVAQANGDAGYCLGANLNRIARGYHRLVG